MDNKVMQALVNEIRQATGTGDHVSYVIIYGTNTFRFLAPNANTEDDLANVLEEAAAFLRADKREIEFEEQLDPKHNWDGMGETKFKEEYQCEFKQ